MAWQMALMAAPLVMQLGTSIFSLFKGRKVKKQVQAQMAQAAAEQKMQMAQVMGNFQGQNAGAVGGINRNYMMPSGIGGPGAGYGPAPQGYFPPGYA